MPSAAARSRSDFVLSGTIVCGHCGGAYNGTTGTSSNRAKVRYYACITMRRCGKGKCASPSVPADELETLVTDALLSTYADSDVFEAAITAHLTQRETQVGPLSAELEAAGARWPETASQDGDHALAGEMFANRASGWS